MLFLGDAGSHPQHLVNTYVPFLEMTLTTKLPLNLGPWASMSKICIYIYGNLEGSHIKSPKNTDFVLPISSERQLWRISTHESVREMYAGKAGMGIRG